MGQARRDAFMKDLEDVKTMSNPRRFLRQKIVEMSDALKRIAEVNRAMGWDFGRTAPWPERERCWFPPPQEYYQEERATLEAFDRYEQALENLPRTPEHKKPFIAFTPERQQCWNCYDELLADEAECRRCGVEAFSPIKPVSTRTHYPAVRPRRLLLPEEFGDMETQISKADEPISALGEEMRKRQDKNRALTEKIEQLNAEEAASSKPEGSEDELDLESEYRRLDLMLLHKSLKVGQKKEEDIRVQISKLTIMKEDDEELLKTSLQPYDQSYQTEFSPPPKTLEQQTNEMCDAVDAAVGDLVTLDDSLMTPQPCPPPPSRGPWSPGWTPPSDHVGFPDSPSALDESMQGHYSSEEADVSMRAWHGSPEPEHLDTSLGLLSEDSFRPPDHLPPRVRARPLDDFLDEDAEARLRTEDSAAAFDDIQRGLMWDRIVETIQYPEDISGVQATPAVERISQLVVEMRKEGADELDDSNVAQLWSRLVEPDQTPAEDTTLRDELNKMNEELDEIEAMVNDLLPYQTYFEEIGPVATEAELTEFELSRVPQSMARKLQSRAKSPSPPMRHLPHGIRLPPPTPMTSPPLPRVRGARARRRRAAQADETPRRAPPRRRVDFIKAFGLPPPPKLPTPSRGDSPPGAMFPLHPAYEEDDYVQNFYDRTPSTPAPPCQPTPSRRTPTPPCQPTPPRRSRTPPCQPTQKTRPKRTASAANAFMSFPELPPPLREESPPGAKFPLHPAYELDHYVHKFYERPSSPTPPRQLTPPRRSPTPLRQPTPPRRTPTPPCQPTPPRRTPTPPRQPTPPRRSHTPPCQPTHETRPKRTASAANAFMSFPELPPPLREESPPGAKFPLHPAYELDHYVHKCYERPRSPTPPRQLTPPRRSPTPPRQPTPPRRSPTPPLQATPTIRTPTPPCPPTPTRRSLTPPRQPSPPIRTPTPPCPPTSPRRSPTPPRQATPTIRTPTPPCPPTPTRRTPTPPPGARYPLHPAYDWDVPLYIRRRCPPPPEWPEPIPHYQQAKIKRPTPPRQPTPPKVSTPPRQPTPPLAATPTRKSPDPNKTPTPSPDLSPPLPRVIPPWPTRPVSRYQPYRAQPPVNYPDIAEINETGEGARKPGTVWRQLFMKPGIRRFFGFRASDIALGSEAVKKGLLQKSFKVIETKLNEIRRQKEELERKSRKMRSEGVESTERAFKRLKAELEEVKKKQALLARAVPDLEAEAEASKTPLTRTPRYYSPARPVKFTVSDQQFTKSRLAEQEDLIRRKNLMYSRATVDSNRYSKPERRSLTPQPDDRAMWDFTPPGLPPPLPPPLPSPPPLRLYGPRIMRKKRTRPAKPNPTLWLYNISYDVEQRFDEFTEKMEKKAKEKEEQKEREREEAERIKKLRQQEIEERQRKIEEREKQERLQRQKRHEILMAEVRVLQERAEKVKSGEFGARPPPRTPAQPHPRALEEQARRTQELTEDRAAWRAERRAERRAMERRKTNPHFQEILHSLRLFKFPTKDNLETLELMEKVFLVAHEMRDIMKEIDEEKAQKAPPKEAEKEAPKASGVAAHRLGAARHRTPSPSPSMFGEPEFWSLTPRKASPVSSRPTTPTPCLPRRTTPTSGPYTPIIPTQGSSRRTTPVSRLATPTSGPSRLISPRVAVLKREGVRSRKRSPDPSRIGGPSSGFLTPRTASPVPTTPTPYSPRRTTPTPRSPRRTTRTPGSSRRTTRTPGSSRPTTPKVGISGLATPIARPKVTSTEDKMVKLKKLEKVFNELHNKLEPKLKEYWDIFMEDEEDDRRAHQSSGVRPLRMIARDLHMLKWDHSDWMKAQKERRAKWKQERTLQRAEDDKLRGTYKRDFVRKQKREQDLEKQRRVQESRARTMAVIESERQKLRDQHAVRVSAVEAELAREMALPPSMQSVRRQELERELWRVKREAPYPVPAEMQRRPLYTTEKGSTDRKFKHLTWQEILYPAHVKTPPEAAPERTHEETMQAIKEEISQGVSGLTDAEFHQNIMHRLYPTPPPAPFEEYNTLADVSESGHLWDSLQLETPRSHPGDPHVMENYFYRMMEMFHYTDDEGSSSLSSEGCVTPPSDYEDTRPPLPGRGQDMELILMTLDDTARGVRDWLERYGTHMEQDIVEARQDLTPSPGHEREA